MISAGDEYGLRRPSVSGAREAANEAMIDSATAEAAYHAERMKGLAAAAKTIAEIRNSKMTPALKALTLQIKAKAAELEAESVRSQIRADLIHAGVDVVSLFDRTMLTTGLSLYMDSL